MKRYLPFLIVAFVAALALGGGFALYRSKPAAAATASKDGKDATASGGHVRGTKGARVTIEEFGDFQCPPCSVMATLLKKLEEDYKGNVRLIFHHFPLPMHANARPAAHAVEAAHLQGHFWEMHDLLYKEQGNWSKATDVLPLLSGYAGSLGLDVERFKKDMESEATKGVVEADHTLGASRGVTSTPTLFVNNTLLPPTALNPDGLHKAIDAALTGKDKPKP